MIDHDRLFKELISIFFLEFLDLFLPEVRAYVEDGSLELLDKEIFTDVTSGERHEVDLLAKLRFKREETFFLVHVENQAQTQPNFGKRMHAYFARLHEKHDLPIYPIALFTYDVPLTKQADTYRVEFPDQLVLDFRFRVIQLNQLNWSDFVRQENPVASALMAKMRIASGDRPKVKLECIRLFVSLKLNRAKMQLLLGFVDNYLRLNEAEDAVYRAELEELATAEKEELMELTMSWREKALQEGLQQGRQEGRQEGRQQGLQQGMLSVIMQQIELRLGPIETGVGERINNLSTDQLKRLAGALLEFTSVEDLGEWLDKL